MSFYGQNDTLAVIRHTDNDFVVPKNLKVAFIGFLNEIFIDVPNAKSFAVSGKGIEKVSKNVYKLYATTASETIIIINIVLKNNRKFIEKHIFKNRTVGIPITYFNYSNGDKIITTQKSKFKNAVIRIITRDKNLNLTFKVNKFKVHISGRPSIQIIGDKIDDRTFNEINRYASRLDEIVIYDISAEMVPNLISFCKLATPMVIKVL